MQIEYKISKNYLFLKDELLNIQDIFTNTHQSIHKARNELKIIEINGIKCVVKSFKIPHTINQIAYSSFRDSKAKKSFINGGVLKKLGIGTPDPIGYIEFYKNGLIQQSYFISLYLPYIFTVREIFRHQTDEHEILLKQFSEFTYKLHKNNIWHMDYTSGNILITKDDSSYNFSLVDINRMKFKHVSLKLGLSSFSKFWSDDNDLKIMVKEYAECANIQFSDAYKIAHNTSLKVKRNKKIKNFLKLKHSS